MKPLHLLIYPPLVSIAVLVGSCKKENQTYPTVEITSPQTAETFSYRDTIRLQADIADRDGRVSVEVMKGSSVINFDQEKLIDNGGNIAYQLYYTDRYLEGGAYDLRVMAYNGDNYSSDFQKIYLKELPLERLGLAALSRGGSGSLLSLYSEEEGLAAHTLAGDYSSLAFSGYQQRIAVAPQSTGNLQGLDTNLKQEYSIPLPNQPGLRQYNDLESHDQWVYSYEQQGFIRGWTATGTMERNYRLSDDMVPLTAAFGEPGMLVNAQEAGKELFHLYLLRPVNGAIIKQAPVPGKAVDLAYAGNSRYVAAVERDGNTLILVYNVVNNMLTQFDEIEGERPLSLVALSGGQVLMSTQQRTYSFNVLQSSLPVVLHSFAAADMAYDATNGEVFYAVGSDVLSSSGSGMPALAFSTGEPVVEIEIIYNK